LSVFNDNGAVDKLTAEADLDWFFRSVGDKLTDDRGNETVTNTIS